MYEDNKHVTPSIKGSASFCQINIKMDSLLERLERVTSRLEQLEVRSIMFDCN